MLCRRSTERVRRHRRHSLNQPTLVPKLGGGVVIRSAAAAPTHFADYLGVLKEQDVVICVHPQLFTFPNQIEAAKIYAFFTKCLFHVHPIQASSRRSSPNGRIQVMS